MEKINRNDLAGAIARGLLLEPELEAFLSATDRWRKVGDVHALLQAVQLLNKLPTHRRDLLWDVLADPELPRIVLNLRELVISRR